MPFVRIDDAYDDEGEASPRGDFEYDADFAFGDAQAFDASALRGPAGVTLAALRGLGATRFRVRYDGGHDEGFAHGDAIFLADGTGRAIEDVAVQLATPAFVADVRAAVAADPRGCMYGNATSVYSKADAAQVVGYAIDELSYAIASTLLGDGFGTGEYSMYGALTADLTTGEIVDDPAAPRPPDVE